MALPLTDAEKAQAVRRLLGGGHDRSNSGQAPRTEPTEPTETSIARIGGKWVKGCPSPNPGGRPKEVAEVRELARQHSEQAIGTLVKIMDDTEAPAAARVAAASAILDRGHGKPGQSITVGQAPYERSPLDALMDTDAEARATMLDIMERALLAQQKTLPP